jgi:hypothetical protein
MEGDFVNFSCERRYATVLENTFKMLTTAMDESTPTNFFMREKNGTGKPGLFAL